MRNKTAWQAAVCIGICSIALWAQKSDNMMVSKYYTLCSKAVMHQIAKEEVVQTWHQMTNALQDAPSRLVSAVIAVNETSKYGKPIDMEGSGTIRQVHAVAGGKVLKTGKNKEYGLYVMIQHEDAVSIYGNLEHAGVVEQERVQRGEIIGSYDSANEDEFYYELCTDL